MMLSLSPVARRFRVARRFQPATLSAIFTLLILVAFGGGNHLNAQTPLARFVAPTNTTSTAVQPTFEIITSLPIDTTSVHWNLDIVDSSHAYGPTICVIPYYIDTSSSDSLWPYQSVKGTGTIINDTTIEFTPNQLPNSNEFAAILMGLRVISGGDTITIPDTVARMTFTTISLPPRLITLSLIDSSFYVRQHDTITAYFSDKLDSVNSPSGPLLSLSIPKMVIDTVHHTITESDSAISTTAWLDSHDSTKLHLLATGAFKPGQSYSIAVKLSGLTGDTTQDFSAGFICRKSYRLNLAAAPTGGLTCMPTIHFDPVINENYKLQYDSTVSGGTVTYDTSVVHDSSIVGRVLNAGDTVTYTAPSQVGSAVFKHWTGSGNPAIDTSTNPVLTISQTADQLHDVNVVALYGSVAVDTVCVSVSGANNPTHNQDFVVINSDSLDCPLATLHDTNSSMTSTNYLLERGKTITLHAYSLADTVVFGHWQSADTNINGSTSPFVRVVTNGSECATAIFVLARPPYFLCAQIAPNNVIVPSDAQILAPDEGPSANPACIYNEACAPFTATLQINNHCYGLAGYTDDDNGKCHQYHHAVSLINPADGNPMDLWAGGNGQFSVSTNIDATNVVFYLKKLQHTLTIVLKTDDGELPDGTNLTFSTNSSNYNKMWIAASPSPILESVAQSTNGSFIYTLTYYACTNVTLNCGTNSCYTFVNWDETNPPNTDPAGSSAATNPNLSVIMDQNRQVTAIFKVPFKLVSYSFWQWPRMPNLPAGSPDPGGGDPTATGPVLQTITYDPNATSIRIPGLWASSSNTWPQSQAASITLNFNKECWIPWGYVQEQTDAFDRKKLSGFSNTIAGAYSKSFTEALEDGWNNPPDWHTWKGQNVDLYIPSMVEYPDIFVNLCVPITLSFSTENPDVEWDITNTTIDETHDDCWWPDDCDACAWTYWMAQSTGVWTDGTTCINTSLDNGASLPAYNLQATGGDSHCDCDGSGQQIMISYPHCWTGVTLSAGAVNRSQYSPSAPNACWDLREFILPTLQADAASPSSHTELSSKNYNSIGSSAVDPLTRPAATHLSSDAWINCDADFPQATGPQNDWWGAGGTYSTNHWEAMGLWACISIQVILK